jgi:hypothetical protein
LEEKDINVSVDGQEIGTWTIRNHSKYSPLIPRIRISRNPDDQILVVGIKENEPGKGDYSIGVKSISLYKRL